MRRLIIGCFGWFCIMSGLLICTMAGCTKKQLDQQFWIERGQNTLKPFQADLKSALMEGLESGPEDAIEVCRLLAPEIAEDISSETVRVGRTSHRLRNKQNAPRAWIQPLLDEYVKNPYQTGPQVVSLPDSRVGFVAPIYVKPMCLACHGRSLSPAVAAKIDEFYPGDQSRGFNDGDFRGLFWVEFMIKK